MTPHRLAARIALVLCLLTAGLADGPALAAAIPLLRNCPADTDLTGYRANKSYLDNPFDFLPWVHARDEAAKAQISRLVDGQPYRQAIAVTQALDVIDNQEFFPSSAVRLKVIVDKVEAVNCSGSTLDLLYHVYTSQVAPGVGETLETRTTSRQAPQVSSGLAQTDTGAIPGAHLVPVLGFDATDKLYAGGQLTLPVCSKCALPLQLIVSGQGSQTMESVQGTLNASKDSIGSIVHSDYALNYSLTTLPTGSGQLRRAEGSIQYAATSKTFLDGALSARFGGLLKKGDAQALLRVPLPAGASATPLNALKLYGGLNAQLPHNVLSASVGLELGTTDVGAGVQWKKYIGDLHDDFWYNLGGKHIVDIDSRLTLGAIQSASPVPAAERFFGGNYEQMFIPGDAWQIRSDPVIRAIPGSRFYETASGAGADRFLSFNLTAALAVWQKPLVPLDIRAQILGLLDTQLGSLTSIQQLHYATTEPGFRKMVAELPVAISALTDLRTAVTNAQRAHPNQLTAQFQACSDAARMAANRAKAALPADSQQYVRISALLKEDKAENRLEKVLEACDPALIDLKPILMVQMELETDYAAIQQSATAEAEAEMKPVRRTVHTLFSDVNLVSISPVAVFDFAKVGPAGPGLRDTRYGPGAGLRLELASSAHFTVGYARNLRPGPGEGSGAFFFSLGFRDLFQ